MRITRSCFIAIGVVAVLYPSTESQVRAGPTERPGPTTQKAVTSAPVEQVVLLEGQCVDARGAGVPGLEVSAELKSEGGKTIRLDPAKTDKMGDFSITAPKRLKGTAVVTMKRWGYVDHTTEVELDPEGLPPFVDVQLKGAVVAFGIVTDAKSGAPVASARVVVQSGFDESSAVTDDGGKFRVPGLLPGPGVITVTADGYGRAQEEVARFEDFGEQIILLRPGRTVHIRTVDTEGKPVGDVAVEVVCEESDTFLAETSDPNGELILRGLDRSCAKLVARVEREGYVASVGFDRTIELPEDERESRHDLVLTLGGTVSGTITEASTGRPINGVRVLVGEGFPDYLPRAWSDWEGAYEVIGVPPGESPVTVHLAGYAPELKVATAEAGKKVTLDFQLSPGSEVAGVVVDAEGKPVAEAYVGAAEWRSYGTLGLQALTDEAGRFAMDSAPTDEFKVAVMHKGYERLEGVAVRGGTSDYRIELHSVSSGLGGGWLKVGDDAPPLEVVTLDGKRVTLAELKGKWVVLDFWATWCTPCLAEIPNLKSVREAFGKRGDFVMISISLDDDEKALRRAIQDASLDWLHVFGDAGGARKAADAYGANAIPLLVVIDPAGKIAAIDLHGPGMKAAVGRLIERTDK